MSIITIWIKVDAALLAALLQHLPAGHALHHLALVLFLASILHPSPVFYLGC